MIGTSEKLIERWAPEIAGAMGVVMAVLGHVLIGTHVSTGGWVLLSIGVAAASASLLARAQVGY